MTTLTALATPAGLSQESLRPLPWGRMAWVTWRQHRGALGGVVAFLGAVAVYVWVTGLQLHHAYAAAIACHPTGSDACNELAFSFNHGGQVLASGYVLQTIPVLIGAFVGAPVLARELETGTFRYAWTQGFGRWRWALAKLVVLPIALAGTAGAVSVLFSWYYQPYFASANQSLALTQWSPLTPGLFDLRGVALVAWTVAAFAIGALAGVLLRRVVPAIVATLAAYTALAFVTGGYLRAHYLAAVVTTRLHIPSSAWVLSQQWLTKTGQPVSSSALGRVLQQGAPHLAGKGGVPHALNSWQYLVQHGYTQWTTYQLSSRFWPFQWIETTWLLALSVLLVAMTVRLVRRTPA